MALDAWGIWGTCYSSIFSYDIFARVSPLALYEGADSLFLVR